MVLIRIRIGKYARRSAAFDSNRPENVRAFFAERVLCLVRAGANLVTGLTADRFNRRFIMAICLSVELLCALGFLAFANAQAHEVWPIFGILVVLGTARAFWGPAAQSLAPNLVPPEALSNAITVNASAWQMASILGPAAGGLLYTIGSATLGFRWPNPWPRHFGYHEVFHTLVVLAALCHWTALYLLITR